MPVDFEAYSPDDGRLDLTKGTNAHRILSVLLEHPGVGFTPGELRDQTGVARGSVSPTLSRLEDAGLVRHKGVYWAAVEDDRIAAASAAVLGLDAAADPHDDDDWYAEHPGWDAELPDLRTERADDVVGDGNGNERSERRETAEDER